MNVNKYLRWSQSSNDVKVYKVLQSHVVNKLYFLGLYLVFTTLVDRGEKSLLLQKRP